MTPTGVVLVVLAAFTAFLGAVGAVASIIWARSQVAGPAKKPTRGQKTEYLEVLSAKVAALETKVEDLPGAWEEARERTKKQADRAAQAVRDLEDRLARLAGEHDSDEDGGGDDALGGEDQQVLSLHGDLDGDPSDSLETRAAEALAMFGRR